MVLSLAWIWTIMIGAILLTPVGPFCIAWDHPLANVWVRILGAGTLVPGAVGLRRQITSSPGSSTSDRTRRSS